jgi:hypothetical protein
MWGCCCFDGGVVVMAKFDAAVGAQIDGLGVQDAVSRIDGRVRRQGGGLEA